MAHFDHGRFDIATPNLRHITQLHMLARAPANGHVAQLFDGFELTSDTDLHHVQRGLQQPRAFDRVLLPDLRHHCIHVQTPLGHALLRYLDEYFFVLHAKQLDLGHVLDAQQLLAHRIGKHLGLGIGVTIGLQAINHPIYIAKVIVEKWPLHALWQGVAHVANFFAHRVPNVRHLAGFGVVFDLKNDLRLTGFGVAADLVRVRRLLQAAFDLVGDLFGHLLGRGPGPIGAHHHQSEGEGWVLILAQAEISRHTQHHQHHHQVARERRVVDGPQRQVEALGLRWIHGALLGVCSGSRGLAGR